MSGCAVCARLQCHAHLGRELREALVEAGSPVWKPAEDLSWRSWVERYGDEEARGLVAAIDELLVEMVAGSESGGTPKKGQRRALRRRFRDQTVSRRAS